LSNSRLPGSGAYPRRDLVEALVGGRAIAPQIAAAIFPL
jgi:hypothetical protein